jgi:hypothetical protein
MTAKMNWRRLEVHQRMRRHGFEGVNGGTRSSKIPPLVRIQRPPPSRPPQIKHEPHRETAKAFLVWRAKQGQP